MFSTGCPLLGGTHETICKFGSSILPSPLSPFICEMEDIHEKNIDELYSDFEEIIQRKRAIFEKYKVMTEIIESIQKEAEEKNTGNDDSGSEGFVDEETTTKDELDNFETWAKDQAKRSLMKHKDMTTIVEVEDIRKLIIKLNEQQRKILDHFL